MVVVVAVPRLQIEVVQERVWRHSRPVGLLVGCSGGEYVGSGRWLFVLSKQISPVSLFITPRVFLIGAFK